MKKKILKAVAFFAALVLLGGVCFLINGFFGNPISKHLATKNAELHIEENYPGQGYTITHVSYNFVTGDYTIQAKVPNSVDSTFYMNCGFDGKIKRDSYKSDILQHQNTADRINKAYSDAVDEVLNNPNFPYQLRIAGGKIEFAVKNDSDMPYYAIIQDELETDALYNLDELGAKAGHIYITIEDDVVTAEHLAQIMLDIKSLMDQGGIEFYAMDCSLHYPSPTDGSEWNYECVAVNEFLYSDIYAEGMVERVLLAKG